METWIDIPKNSDFSIHNIPFGIFSTKDSKKRVGIAIGDMILDLKLSSDLGVFDNLSFDFNIFENEYLNDFISLGKSITNNVRLIIQNELSDSSSVLRKHNNLLILLLSQVQLNVLYASNLHDLQVLFQKLLLVVRLL